jgi:phosphoribosylanthranilate isomerase
MPVRLKVCGITRVDDAEIACRLGADAIGFVFWAKSPRAIAPEQARAISRRVPPFVTRVGVFVNASAAEIGAVADRVPLDVVQLHGDEDLVEYAGLRVRLLKAVTLADHADVERASSLPPDVVPLVDAPDAERRGGTGRFADWDLAAVLAAERRIVLAGGLTADNVAEAVGRVRPWAVDVSSGVEDRPGVKDPRRLAAFVGAISDLRETGET